MPDGSVGDSLEIRLNFSTVVGKIGVLARQTADGTEGIRVLYDGELTLTTESRNPNDHGAGHFSDAGEALAPGTVGKYTLRVYIDKSVVEAHLNARRSITTRFYPLDLNATTGAFGVKLYNDANVTATVDSIEVWGMRSIY